MSVLRAGKAREGDTLYVTRYLKDGTQTMAKPCVSCQRLIALHGIKRVYFTDWQGQWQKLV